MFATLAAGLVLYGMIVLIAVVSEGSFRVTRSDRPISRRRNQSDAAAADSASR
jgi:hypothetical protein